MNDHTQVGFKFQSYLAADHFAIDNVRFIGEYADYVSHNVQGFRLWLNGNLVGDVADSEYQLDTDTLTEGQTYTFSVAAI